MTQNIVFQHFKPFDILISTLFGKKNIISSKIKRTILNNRSQEIEKMQEYSIDLMENGARMVKTSEDQYERPSSSTSKSSIDQENESPKSNAQSHIDIHQFQIVKPNIHRVLLYLID